MGPALNLLLDSSTLIWATSVPLRLTEVARKALTDGANEVWVSAASAWEIVTKHRLGRLDQVGALADDWTGTLETSGFRQLDITHGHAVHAGSYDVAHGDPFDRIIAAQAELEDMAVVASDRSFDLFPVSRLW